MSNDIRIIAFYLPQYHPIPENDRWWGKGFTEWTNVTKSKPLFKGHEQPKQPADFGFYDLRVPEVREAQAELARQYGIEGFCYWHYWFDGKRLLETPFNEVVRLQKPDFPFCVAWANVPWTGEWAGDGKKVLIDFKNLGVEDYRSHFYELLEAFSDKRYIKIDGRLAFYIHSVHNIPVPTLFIETWNELADKEGLPGFYFIGNNIDQETAVKLNFNAYSYHFPDRYILTNEYNKNKSFWKKWSKGPVVFDYLNVLEQHFYHNISKDEMHIPLIFPNWDNSPRYGKDAMIFENSSPENFRIHIRKVLDMVGLKRNKIVFLKSWNEWAEGNYMEPDRKYGHAYLQVLKEELGKK